MLFHEFAHFCIYRILRGPIRLPPPLLTLFFFFFWFIYRFLFIYLLNRALMLTLLYGVLTEVKIPVLSVSIPLLYYMLLGQIRHL